MLEKVLLAPYYLTLKVRHALYDSGIYKVHTCGVPTICVGNITAGGTGKTPHTEMILKTLFESDEWGRKNISVLSRGHKRKSGGFQLVTLDGRASFFGDEPLQIKKKYPLAIVAVDRTRVEGCDFLCNPEKLKSSRRARKCVNKEIPPSDLIILDDAFQYRSLKAWFNIVLVDYQRPLDKDRLLPFGRLRDLPERLDFADIIIVSKCPSFMNEWEKCEWAASLGLKDFSMSTCSGTNRHGRKVTLLFTTINYCPLHPIFEEGDQRYTYAKNLILFSGIAKDTPLRRFLSDSYKIVKHFRFSDHHKYNLIDIKKIENATREYPTAVVATTEKDSQRILDYKRVPMSLKKKMFQVPIEVGFTTENELNIFRSTLMDALQKFHPDY